MKDIKGIDNIHCVKCDENQRLKMVQEGFG